MGEYLVLGFATGFTLGALLVTSVSFGTDHWVDSTVDRNVLSATQREQHKFWFYTRYRGIFRTCLVGNETAWLDTHPDVTDTNCLRQRGFELQPNSATIGHGEDYSTRKHLLRAHVAFQGLGILFLLIGCIMGIVGCWQSTGSVVRASGIVVFLAALFVAGGMAVFHGYEYLENNKIDEEGFYFNYKIEVTTTREYGWSYILGWLGVAMAAVSAILFLCAAFSLTKVDDDDDQFPLEYPRMKGKKRPRHNQGYGGYPGYDYPEMTSHLSRKPTPHPMQYQGQYPGQYPGYTY